MKLMPNSKKFAWVLLAITTMLAAYAISKELEGAVMAIFSSGTMAAAGLYANKQHVDLKQQTLEIQKNSQNGKSEHEKNS